MRVINTNELQNVAGGCPVCPIVPGACIAVGATTAIVGYMGWGSFWYGVSTALLLGGGYLTYDYFSKQHDHATESEVAFEVVNVA